MLFVSLLCQTSKGQCIPRKHFYTIIPSPWGWRVDTWRLASYSYPAICMVMQATRFIGPGYFYFSSRVYCFESTLFSNYFLLSFAICFLILLMEFNVTLSCSCPFVTPVMQAQCFYWHYFRADISLINVAHCIRIWRQNQ